MFCQNKTITKRVICYSSLFPFANHYFAVCGVDGSEHYRPESKVVIDIYSAWLVLSPRNASKTLAQVTSTAKEVADSWNADYSSPQVQHFKKLITHARLCKQLYDCKKNHVFCIGHLIVMRFPYFYFYRTALVVAAKRSAFS